MANSLHNLFHAVATAKNEYQLRMRFMDNISEHFGISRLVSQPYKLDKLHQLYLVHLHL
ncbi:hypothetical protein [Rivularia sp. PCC 7116]|uniref:hypothetical protein n=1 Tax=Rivularia sp. PCC 7116 TaxID=373994 RepID=UPI0002DAB086|nr:hypothetical protein [Rivularia sp. PCC 7116]